MIGFITWLFDKITAPLVRLWSRPKLDVERVRHVGWGTAAEAKVSVNLAITLKNTGRAAAESFRAEARTDHAFVLLDPRIPGNATARQESGEYVIAWQSTEPWPPEHTRQIEGKLHMTKGERVVVRITLKAPHARPAVREVEVTWPASDPVMRVLP